MTDTWNILAAPIPPEHISQREGHHGKMLDYIDRPVVWQRLDEAAQGEWTVEFQPLALRADAKDGEPYAMLCTLAVNGVRREGVGQGADWKEAETDAFKRAAVHFGVGRQLYGTVGEHRPSPAAAPSRSKPSSKPSTSGPSGPSSGERMPFGKHKGKLLSDVAVKDLESTVAWCTEKDPEKFASLIEKCEAELRRRMAVVGDYSGPPLEAPEDSLPF